MIIFTNFLGVEFEIEYSYYPEIEQRLDTPGQVECVEISGIKINGNDMYDFCFHTWSEESWIELHEKVLREHKKEQWERKHKV